MNSTKRPLTYQKILFSKLVGVPVAVAVSFVSGVVCAGQVWLKSDFELVPTELVVALPPPNTAWCFPDVVFTKAEKFSKELRKQMSATHATQYNDTTLSKSTKAVIRQNKPGREDYYQLRLMATTPDHFAAIAASYRDTDPSNYTLVTEQGYFYLHTIPKHRHEKYDSLVSARLGYRK